MDQKPLLFKEEEEENNEEARKSCTACKTTNTPLWRTGPAGPKSLCNACGIRYRKKRGPHPDGMIKDTDHSSSGSMRVRFLVMGKKVILQSPRPKPSPSPSPSPSSRLSPSPSSSYPPRVVVVVKKQRCQRRRRRMKEEEMAAFSLMALSCGSVFA